MKLKIRLLLLLFVGFESMAVSCPTNYDFCEIYGTQITSVYVNDSGLALIKVSGFNGWLTIGNVAEQESVRFMYSTALAIKTTQYERAWVRWHETTKTVKIISYDWQ